MNPDYEEIENREKLEASSNYIYINFVVTRLHGTKHMLQIEVDREYNCINVPASGDLVGQENIDIFLDAIKSAAKELKNE